MASSLVDLVKINVSNTGSGAITLGSAVEGYRGRDVLTNGTVYSYSIQQGSAWEFGRGTYLAESAQIIRSVIDSSDGGTALDLKPNAQIAFTALSADLMPQVQLTAEIAADRTAAETAAGVATTAAGTATTKAGEAAASATLSGLYANADTDADIPGAAPGERGAAWYALVAEGFAGDAANSVSGVKVEFGGTFINTDGIAAGATRLDESTQALYTMERLVTRVQIGTGSIPVYFLINGVDLVGPVTVTPTLATSTISVAIPANATVDIQFGTATGAVTGVFAKMQGRIGA